MGIKMGHEITIEGKKYVLKEPTFEVACKIEDVALEITDEGKIMPKGGYGTFKMHKLHQYIESIEGVNSVTFDYVKKLNPKVAKQLLAKLDEIGA